MNDALLAIQEAGLRSLATAMNGGHCLALIGAGPVSRDFGSWKELLLKLNENMNNGDPPPGMLEKYPDDQVMKELAETLYTRDKGLFCRLMLGHFGREENIPQVYNSVLRAKFRGILTTNFDNQLINTANLCGLGPKFTQMAYPALKPEVQGAVVHLHGRIKTEEDVENIIFTQSQFARGYISTGVLPSFLNTIFYSYHLCFIGYSFSETEIQDIFKASKRHFQDQFGNADRRQVFALIDESNWESVASADGSGTQYDVVSRMKSKFETFGITPIPYLKVNDQYPGLRQVIERLPVQYPLPNAAPAAWLPSNEQNMGGIE